MGEEGQEASKKGMGRSGDTIVQISGKQEQ